MLCLLFLTKLKKTVNSGLLLNAKTTISVMIEAVEPSKVILKLISNTNEVFDNIHMLWMCIWMILYYDAAALLHQA
jgi:hypothetical protein